MKTTMEQKLKSLAGTILMVNDMDTKDLICYCKEYNIKQSNGRSKNNFTKRMNIILKEYPEYEIHKQKIRPCLKYGRDKYSKSYNILRLIEYLEEYYKIPKKPTLNEKLNGSFHQALQRMRLE